MKRFDLKYGYHENYFVASKNGELSINDILNLLHADHEEFYDCVKLKDNKLVYNDLYNNHKNLADFLEYFCNEIEQFFKLENFNCLSDKEKYDYLEKYFYLAYTTQSNPTFIESSYKRDKFKAYIQVGYHFDGCSLDEDDIKKVFVKNTQFSDNLFYSINSENFLF